ncbi:MAG: helix-turn-helix domain-containing protein [Bdellovibrionales bacterium]|nr:helix-turn-helix domain-containing protein [Bdellovibrionales bacterium]
MFTEIEDINSYRSKIAANLASHARKKFKLSTKAVSKQFGMTEDDYIKFEAGEHILDEQAVFDILEYYLISREKIKESFELSQFLYFYDISEVLMKDSTV